MNTQEISETLKSEQKCDAVNTDDILAVLDEFLEESGKSSRGHCSKEATKTGIEHLKKALKESGLPLKQFVAEDGLIHYTQKLRLSVSAKYIERLKDPWRKAFRYFCKRRLLALDYSRCAALSKEKDPYDLEKWESGYPEAWLGIYPASIVPIQTMAAIQLNDSIPEQIKKEYRLIVENHPECERDATRATHWATIRQLALELKLNSLKDLASLEGAQKLMDYFLMKGFTKNSTSLRRIMGMYLNLKKLGITGDPFKIQERVNGVLRPVIDLNRLPKTNSTRMFFGIKGRLHVRVGEQILECRLTMEDLKKIAAYGNPALERWKDKPQEELLSVFQEAQENIIARTVLYFQPRPIEFSSMNWGNWGKIEEAHASEFLLLYNNAHEHRRKTRPDRPLPCSYFKELSNLWELRRAAFALKGDPDKEESLRPGMLRSGIAMWIDPQTGKRLNPTRINQFLRKALLRMGISPLRAERATLYWLRKADQTFARTHAGGVGDKFLAAQAGHSEEVMKKRYDGPEILAQAQHMRDHLWSPLGVVSAPEEKLSASSSFSAPMMGHVTGQDLILWSGEMIKALKEQNIGIETTVEPKRLNEITAQAAFHAGLLYSYQEAAKILDVDVRTLERWENSKIIEPIRLSGHRYILKSQVNELAQSLSPEEAGRLIELSGRQVRNLIQEGKFPEAFARGKKWFIPLAALRAYRGSQSKDSGQASAA